jgi:hypothetical protein
MAAVLLNKLQPGKTYTVAVKAINSDGDMSPNSITYTFTTPRANLDGSQLVATNTTVVTAIANDSASVVGGALTAGSLDANGLTYAGKTNLATVWNSTSGGYTTNASLTSTTASAGAVIINSTGILGYQFGSATNVGQANFFLNTLDGNAYFRGTIFAAAGQIGNWNINNLGIYRSYYGTSSLGSFGTWTYTSSVNIVSPTNAFSDFIANYSSASNGSDIYSSYLKLGNSSATFIDSIIYDMPLPKLEMQWNLGGAFIKTLSMNGSDGYVFENYDSITPKRTRVWLGSIDKDYSFFYNSGYGIHAQTNGSPGTLQIHPANGGAVQIGSRIHFNSNTIYTVTDAYNPGPYNISIAPAGSLSLAPVGSLSLSPTTEVITANGTLSVTGGTNLGTGSTQNAITTSGTTYRVYLPSTAVAGVSTGDSVVYMDTGTSPKGLLSHGAVSSKRYKHDITTNLSPELNPYNILDINVVQFKYNEGYLDSKDQRNGIDVIGFIAEDVYEKYPIAANVNKDNNPENWNINYLVPAMFKILQDQQKTIENLEHRLASLENK